jgi:hypothetical protein
MTKTNIPSSSLVRRVDVDWRRGTRDVTSPANDTEDASEIVLLHYAWRIYRRGQSPSPPPFLPESRYHVMYNLVRPIGAATTMFVASYGEL